MKIEQQVSRKAKKGTKPLKAVMIILGALFLILGIVFNTGYMLFCFVFAAMFFIFEANSDRDYEYIYEDGSFKIFVIHAKRRRKQVHEINLEELEVVAPHEHEAVRMYKRGNGTKLPKYDYTSYRDDVEYFTMITKENDRKIKLLLDLDENMMAELKYRYPSKVYRQ